MKKRRKKSVMHALRQAKTGPSSEQEDMFCEALRHKGYAPDASDRILHQMKNLGILLQWINRIVFLRPEDPAWRNVALGISVYPPEEMEEVVAQGRIRHDVGLAEQDKTGAISLLSALIWTATTVYFPSEEWFSFTVMQGKRSPKWLARHVRIGVEVTDVLLQEAKSLLERREQARAAAARGLFN